MLCRRVSRRSGPPSISRNANTPPDAPGGSTRDTGARDADHRFREFASYLPVPARKSALIIQISESARRTPRCARIEIGVALEIVQAGHPVLRQQARPLTPGEIAGKEIQTLIESMRKAMYDAPGVGLAAPQIGLSLQLAVIEDRADYHKDVSAEHIREREYRP